MIAAWELEPEPQQLSDALEMLESDSLQAIGRLEAMAKNDSVLSMVYVGDAYLYGDRVGQDSERGEQWLRRAAMKGSIEAAFRLACHYRWIENYDKSIQELTKLSNSGYSPAMYLLGLMNYNGEGVNKNIDQAIIYWKNAADRGHFFATQWYSYLLRKGNFGISSKIRGYLKILLVIIPFVYYKLYYPESDRLRK